MLNWNDILHFVDTGNPEISPKLEKTDAEWKEILTPEQYRITRQSGTEMAHSSDMCSRFEPGIYACVCCKTDLFDSTVKFESGTGWPSFTQPLEPNVVSYFRDISLGSDRIETRCNVCDAHLGHVFPDGPPPSNLRYCINAVALEKK